MATGAPSFPASRLEKFNLAMEFVYGPFNSLKPSEVEQWTPPALPEAYKDHALWTHAFGVINFLTLYHRYRYNKLRDLALRLVNHVHSTFGYTREGSFRLPGTAKWVVFRHSFQPGEAEEHNHSREHSFASLAMWMFALNTMTIATKGQWYNDEAISMAKAASRAFMRETSEEQHKTAKNKSPLCEPLEDNINPILGYVVYCMLRDTSNDRSTLRAEIAQLKSLVEVPERLYHKNMDNALVIGMTLWATHWMKNKELWAKDSHQQAAKCLERYSPHFLMKRVAFEELGAGLGARCIEQWDSVGWNLLTWPDIICNH